MIDKIIPNSLKNRLIKIMFDASAKNVNKIENKIVSFLLKIARMIDIKAPIAINGL